jgi:hypothetical protein
MFSIRSNFGGRSASDTNAQPIVPWAEGDQQASLQIVVNGVTASTYILVADARKDSDVSNW